MTEHAMMAIDLAEKSLVRLMLRRPGMSEREAKDLIQGMSALIDAKVLLMRREIEANLDETRRRFYEVHPSLRPTLGHWPQRDEWERRGREP